MVCNIIHSKLYAREQQNALTKIFLSHSCIKPKIISFDLIGLQGFSGENLSDMVIVILSLTGNWY
jgi:hypothetical protein